MREEQAIIEIIPILRQGEIKNFQVKVPMNANAVIGIETGMRMGSFAVGGAVIPLPAKHKVNPPLAEMQDAIIPSSVAGELKLQSSGKPNVFYGTLVRDPFAGEDFSNPLLFSEKDWTSGYKKEMEKLTIDASTTIISGFYKDNLGASSGRDTSYEIFLAIWFKIERKKK